MEHEEKIRVILQSSLALGHKIQDILVIHGIDNWQARGAARAIAMAVAQHFDMLGATFIDSGHRECGKVLLFEARNLLAS